MHGMARNESEFGGVDTLTGVQPAPHIPDASEQLMLVYRTGDPSGLTAPRNDGVIFAGLRDEAAQRATREAEGALVKGEVAAELAIEAAAELAALAAEAAPE